MRRSGSLAAWLCLLPAVAPLQNAGAATLSVSPDGQGIFPTLQAAIDAASPGDTVLAFPGTFSGLGNRDLDFGGKPISLLGRDGSAATTIDCEYQGRGVSLCSGETLAASLIGFTILHGGDGEINGGGVRCQDASLTVTDIIVREAAAYSCAGIAIVRGSLRASGLLIANNQVPGAAGCLGFYWADSVLVENSVLEGTDVGGYGGVVEVWESPATFVNVVLHSGDAGISGGAIRSQNSTVTCIGCIFQGNEARDGGAIAMRGTTLTLQGCTFIGNYATRWGGALYYDELGDPSGGLVENCAFRGNRANAGSAILVHELGDPTLRGLTIVGNYGTAIDCLYGTVVSIENCLIANNYLAYGISIVDTNGVSVSCCNVWGNEGGNYGGLLEDQTGLNGNISADPLLCDPSYETLGVADDSPCLPANNACGVLMGNHGAECTLTAVGAPAPSGVTLEANHPNPFNPSTTIPFSLASASVITLSIHDVSGRLVCMLADQNRFPAGRHALRWDGRDGAGQSAPSGVYFYRLETAQGATARPMLLVK